MAVNRTIESLDLDAIRRGDGEATAEALDFLRTVLDDEARLRRKGVRLATDRSERLTLPISPTAALDNYDLGDASILRFDGTTAVNVTGLLAPSGGAAREVTLLVLGSATITVKHSDAASEAPNRILTFAAGDLAIATNKAVRLQYHDSRWRELKWA